jgi:digeranylgeranylglycerophospholipid reductase
MKIVIIGGGPIGCYAGYLLSKQGHFVSIYENHEQIGLPIQCTGILTKEFDKFGINIDSSLVNIIGKYEVVSPNGNSTLVDQKDYIVCRHKFDSYLAQLAQEQGALIHLSSSFIRKEGDNLIIKNNGQEKRIQADIVIAADGPLSPTANAYGFYQKRENFYGVQAVVKGKFDPAIIKTYFGNKVCPGLFVWVAPESSTKARVGLASKKESRKYFDKFMQENNYKIEEIQAGTIPIYNPKQKLQKGNCYLVGDASSFVKATTLGGIVPAMEQVQVLVDCIINKKDYSKELWKVKLKMQTHLIISKVISKFSDKDWNKLIGYVSSKKVKKVLKKYNRDNPLPLITGILIKEPRFLGFVKYLW